MPAKIWALWCALERKTMLSIQALWKEQKYVTLRHELLEENNQHVSQLKMVRDFWMFCWVFLIKKFSATFACFSVTFFEETSWIVWLMEGRRGKKEEDTDTCGRIFNKAAISPEEILDSSQAECVNLSHPFYSSYFGMSLTKKDHKSSICSVSFVCWFSFEWRYYFIKLFSCKWDTGFIVS